MAQPEIPGNGVGIPRMPYGSNAAKWIALLVDTAGRLQVDVVDAAGLQGALHDVGDDELDVMVEGFDPVPTTPIWEYERQLSVPDNDYTTVKSETVTTNKSWYITDFWASPFSSGSPAIFILQLHVGGAEVWRGIFPSGESIHINLQTPRKATTGQEVEVILYQNTGSAVLFAAGFGGFEV